VGESFEGVARRFLPRVGRYRPWLAGLLYRLGITKRRRTHYDHLMLGLHDAMKADADYQQNGVQTTVEFAAGTAWVCYSDQTPHAAMSGQHMLEQTLFVALSALSHPELSPLAVLERLSGWILL
ncbi:MAG TPA: Kdo hydroxylase family protein, partial [Methylibium sp.]